MKKYLQPMYVVPVISHALLLLGALFGNGGVEQGVCIIILIVEAIHYMFLSMVENSWNPRKWSIFNH